MRRHGLIFDEAAGLYDRHRPGYPDAAIDDLIASAGLGPGASVLEVGAGTGQATMSLVRRGLCVTAIEPGPRMSRRLARKLAGETCSGVVAMRFEDAPIAWGSFDALVSATAFHWLDPTTRYSLVARSLRPGGALAVIRNHPVGVPDTARYHREVGPIYAREAPELYRGDSMPGPDEVECCPDDMGADGLFRVITARRYSWKERFTSESHVALLRTYSDHRALPRGRRARLHAGIADVIEGSLGGTFVDHYVTTLCVARRS